MISIHLYGKLRRFAPDKSPAGNSILQVTFKKNETLKSLLDRIGIDPDELYTIFLNSKLLTTRTKIAPFLGYQQVNSKDCQDWDLAVTIHDGDRLGLFGSDMSGLVV
jgi:hypothetical protein